MCGGGAGPPVILKIFGIWQEVWDQLLHPPGKSFQQTVKSNKEQEEEEGAVWVSSQDLAVSSVHTPPSLPQVSMFSPMLDFTVHGQARSVYPLVS